MKDKKEKTVDEGDKEEEKGKDEQKYEETIEVEDKQEK